MFSSNWIVNKHDEKQQLKYIFGEDLKTVPFNNFGGTALLLSARDITTFVSN